MAAPPSSSTPAPDRTTRAVNAGRRRERTWSKKILRVSGAKREEIVELKQDQPRRRSRAAGSRRSQPIPREEGKRKGLEKILSMGKTFAPMDMHVLAALARGGLGSDVLGLEDGEVEGEVIRLGFIRCYDAKAKRAAGTAAVATAISDALQSPQALAARRRGSDLNIFAKILLNDSHWQAIRLKLVGGEDGRAKFMAVNSTNEARARPLTEIQQQYEKNGILPGINRALTSLPPSRGSSAPVRIHVKDILYAQGLQYGNMGCGFACALNQLLLENDAFQGRWVRDGDRKTRMVKNTFQVDGETIVFEDHEFDKARSTDRSFRVTLQQEAQLRAELFLCLSFRCRLALSIANELKLRSNRSENALSVDRKQIRAPFPT